MMMMMMMTKSRLKAYRVLSKSTRYTFSNSKPLWRWSLVNSFQAHVGIFLSYIVSSTV